MPSVVLDACVLFPPTLRNTLLHAAAFGLFRPYWGEEILDELRRNLVKRAPMPEENAEGWIAKMREHFPEACIPIDKEQAADLENHPKDRHVLAVAVEADAIVTRNIKDFPEAALAPYGIEAWPPDTLLTVLFQRDPLKMVDVIRFYAESQHKPPRTIQDVWFCQPALAHFDGEYWPTLVVYMASLCPSALQASCGNGKTRYRSR